MALGGLTRGRAPASRAVLLDAMGTLVRLHAPAPALRRGLSCDHGIEVSAERAEHAARAEMAFYRAHHDEGSDPASLARLRLRCAEVLRDALGPTTPGATAEDLLPTLMGALRFSAFADALPALDSLRRAGARLVVVSNWDASLPEVLEKTGLARHLDAVIASAVVGAAKPSPAIFAAALEAVAAPASGALHVGDTIEHDVIGARGAGIAAVLLRRDAPGAAGVHGLPAGVPVIRSLAELAGLAP